MYKVYLKQAFHILREGKLISIISIAGTALAITMVMVIVMMQEIKESNVAPEVNRDRTLYLDLQDIKIIQDKEVVGVYKTQVDYRTVKECILPLTIPEAVTVKSQTNAVINIQGDKKHNSYTLAAVDDKFWNVFSFSFKDGKPFLREEFESGIKVAVISENVAKELFKGENPIGKTIDINFLPYNVVGVVENVSVLCKAAYSEVWVPYKSLPSYETSYYSCSILAKNRADFDKIKQEVQTNQKKLNSILTDEQLDLNGLYDQATSQLDISSSEEAESVVKQDRNRIIFILCIIMIIPAINLSGFSLSKFKSRMSEIGVRKAFGANKANLIMQVLYENMLGTLIGGIIGLLLSVITIFSLKRMFLENSYTLIESGDFSIPVGTLISPSIFISAFAACFVLNILSASIPAYRTASMPIVNALKS
jgi:ABC-type transport system, involved in lipoprotein release, permease component